MMVVLRGGSFQKGIFFLISSLHLCPEPGRSHGQVAGAGLSLHLHKLPLTLLVTDSMSASALSPTYHCRQVSSSSSLHSAYTVPFYLSFQQEITYSFIPEPSFILCVLDSFHLGQILRSNRMTTAFSASLNRQTNFQRIRFMCS